MSRVFYGWWIVGASLVCMVVGIPIVSYTFGNFVNPLNEAFQWSRGQVSLGPSLALLGVTVSQPLLGRLIDRVGVKVVILPCAVGFGASWLALSFLSASLWHFYLLYFFLGLSGGGVGPVPFATVISRWFEYRRGLALGVGMTGLGVGGFLMAPLVQYLIATWGWRVAYAVVGGCVWIIVLPVVALVLRERPQEYGLLPDGRTQETIGAKKENDTLTEPSLTIAEARRTGNFWCLSAAFFLLSIVAHGFLIHFIPLLTDRGMSGQRAALYVALLAASSVVGRGVAGLLADKAQATWPMGSKYVALGYFLGSAVGIGILWSTGEEWGAMIFALLFGFSLGAEVDLFPYMIGRCFGLRAFAELYGYTLAAFGFGGVLGPLVTGAIFDATGSYSVALGGFCVLVLAAAGLMIPLQALSTDRETPPLLMQEPG